MLNFASPHPPSPIPLHRLDPYSYHSLKKKKTFKRPCMGQRKFVAVQGSCLWCPSGFPCWGLDSSLSPHLFTRVLPAQPGCSGLSHHPKQGLELLQKLLSWEGLSHSTGFTRGNSGHSGHSAHGRSICPDLRPQAL